MRGYTLQLSYSKELPQMMTCLAGLQAPDLVCWADETGEIVIFNTHHEKEVIK